MVVVGSQIEGGPMDVEELQRRYLARNLVRQELTSPKETFDLLIKEIMTEPYLTDGNIVEQAIAFSKKPMNS